MSAIRTASAEPGSHGNGLYEVKTDVGYVMGVFEELVSPKDDVVLQAARNGLAMGRDAGICCVRSGFDFERVAPWNGDENALYVMEAIGSFSQDAKPQIDLGIRKTDGGSASIVGKLIH